MRAIVVASLFASVFSITSGAFAADLPPQGPPPARAPAMVVAERYNWTGIYIGAHGGYGWDRLKAADSTFATGADSQTLSGWLAGGQIGANYQTGPFVFGIQGDYAYADIKETVSLVALFGAGSEATFKNDFIATATGRVGYAFDRVLAYVKGGGAWTRDKFTAVAPGSSASSTFNRTGWTAGAGVEWAILGGWTAFAEYNYLSFGAISELSTGTGVFAAATPISLSATMHIGKAGINFRF